MLIEWIQVLVCFSTSWDHYSLLPVLSGITTSCCQYCLGSLLPVACTVWDHYFLLPVLSGIATSCCQYCLGSLLPVACTVWDHYSLLPVLSGIATPCCQYCLGSLLLVASTACCPILHFIEYHSISNYCTVHTYFLRPRLHDAVFPEMVT